MFFLVANFCQFQGAQQFFLKIVKLKMYIIKRLQ
jgi:hypothetical protein